MRLIKAVAVTLVTLFLPLQGTGADLEKGLEAYARGDYQTALEEFMPLAIQGNSSAQNNLGVMYDNGQGVPEDDKEAVKWYRLAAEQGSASAQYNLGFMYANGEGVPEDDKEAVKWYRLAAEQGDAMAQYNLGSMYANGQGVPEDNIMAYMWWNLAAVSGDKSSVKNKQIISERMTKADISKAQELSRQWYKDHPDL